MIILRQRAFSEEPEQKEFNSKTAKALRNAYDTGVGEKVLGKNAIGLSKDEIKKVGRLVNSKHTTKSKLGEKAKDYVNKEITGRGRGEKYLQPDGSFGYHYKGQKKKIESLKSQDKVGRIINKVLHPFKK